MKRVMCTCECHRRSDLESKLGKMFIEFIERDCEIGPNQSVPAGELVFAFQRYWKENSDSGRMPSSNIIGRLATAAGFERGQAHVQDGGNMKIRLGLRLKGA